MLMSIPMYRVRTTVLELIHAINLCYFFNMDLKAWEFYFHCQKMPPNKCCWPLHMFLFASLLWKRKGGNINYPFFHYQSEINFFLSKSYPDSLNNDHLFDIFRNSYFLDVILAILLRVLSSWYTLIPLQPPPY